MEPKDHIFLTLLSNNSIANFPENTQSTFTNNTPLPIALTGGDWEIALTSICLNNFRGSFIKRKKQRETTAHDFFFENGIHYASYLRRFYSKLYKFDDDESDKYTPLKLNPQFFKRGLELYVDVLGDFVNVMYMPQQLLKTAHMQTIDTLVQLVKDTEKSSNVQFSSEILLVGEKGGVTVTDLNLAQRVRRFISTFEEIDETEDAMNVINLLGADKLTILSKYVNNPSPADTRIEGEILLENCLKKIKSMIDYGKLVKQPMVSLKRDRRGFSQFIPKVAKPADKVLSEPENFDMYQEGDTASDIISNEEMIFVNINICQPRSVGDKLIRCVKILPIKNIAKDNLFFEFKKPEYYKVENYYFNHLTVALRNDIGDPIKFFDSDFPIICTFNLRRRKVV